MFRLKEIALKWCSIKLKLSLNFTHKQKLDQNSKKKKGISIVMTMISQRENQCKANTKGLVQAHTILLQKIPKK